MADGPTFSQQALDDVLSGKDTTSSTPPTSSTDGTSTIVVHGTRPPAMPFPYANNPVGTETTTPTDSSTLLSDTLAGKQVYTPPPGQGVLEPQTWGDVGRQQPAIAGRVATELPFQIGALPGTAAESALALPYNLATQTAPSLVGKPPIAPAMPYGPELVHRGVEKFINQPLGIPPISGNIPNLEFSGAMGVGTALAGPAWMGKMLELFGAPETGAAMASQPLRRALVGGGIGTATGEEANLGLSPEAQALSGLALGALSGVAPGATRSQNAADLQDAQFLMDEDVPINAGQVSGMPWFQNITAKLAPKAWADAVAKRFGGTADDDGYLPSTPRTPGGSAPMADAETRINNLYARARNGPDIPLPPSGLAQLIGPTPLETVLSAIEQRVQGNPTLKPVGDYIKYLRQTAAANGGSLSAGMAVDELQTTGYLGQQINKFSSGPNADLLVRNGLQEVRTALQAARDATATPEQQLALSQGAEYYKNWRTAQDATDPVTGRITPDSLAAAVKRNVDFLGPGGGDLGALARAGKKFVNVPPEEKPLPSSTPMINARSIAKGVGTGVGMLAEGALGLGEHYNLLPPGTAALAMAGLPVVGTGLLAMARAARQPLSNLPPISAPGYFARQGLLPTMVQPPEGSPQRPTLF